MSQPGVAASPQDFFGDSGAQGGLPTADQFFAPPKPTIAGRAWNALTDISGMVSGVPQPAEPVRGGPEQDAYIAQHPVGHVLSQFGQGFAQAWGAEPVGAVPEDFENFAKKAGWFNDYSAGHATLGRSFNEALVRPLAGAIYTAARAGGAVLGGTQAATVAAVPNIPSPGGVSGETLGHALAGYEEYAATRGDILTDHALIPAPILKARSLGVIGEGEGGFFGTKDVAPATVEQRAEAIKAHAADVAEQQKATGQPTAPQEGAPAAQVGEPPTAPPVPDIHAVAREIAPDVIDERDRLVAREATYRDWLAELKEGRQQAPEAAELQDRIDTILGKVNGVEDRLTNAARGRLYDAQDQLDDFMRHDTPDMEVVRGYLTDTLERRRQLGPQVASAYQQAQERLPPQPESVIEAPNVQNAGIGASLPGAVQAAPAALPEAPGQPASEGPAPVRLVPEGGAAEAPTTATGTAPSTPDITAAVSQKLVSAGRPKAEADAAGALVADHYDARAARFNGALGTPGELYAREGAEIRGAARGKSALKSAASERVLAQSGEARDPFYSALFQVGRRRGADRSGAGTEQTPIGHIGQDTERRMVEAYNQELPSIDEQYGHHENSSYQVLDRKEAESIYGDYEDVPERLRDIIERHGSAVEITDGNHVEVFPPGEAPSLEGHKREVVQNGGGVFPASDHDDIMRGLETQRSGTEYGSAEAFKVLAKDRGWTVRRQPHADFRYMEVSRDLTPDEIADLKARNVTNEDGDTPESIEIGVRISDHARTSAQGHAIHGKAPVHINIAPGADDFKDAAKALDLAHYNDDGEISLRDDGRRATLFQGNRASITLGEARSTIRLLKNADASSFIHEEGHDWLEELKRDAAHPLAPEDVKADMRTTQAWYNATKQGKKQPWTADEIPTAAHEMWARGFERYMMEGVAPSQRLADVFAKFKAWLTQIYQTVAKLRSPINPDIRAVFDRLISTPQERAIIAPDRAAPQTMADIHEAEAESTSPEHAAIVADNTRREIEETARTHAPEVHDEFKVKTGGSVAPGARAAGGEPAPGSAAGENRVAAEPGTQPAGGSEVAKEGAGARAKPVASVYERVPKEPLRLIDFIKKNGGIRDDHGDIAVILGGAKGRPGLIRKNGVPPDDMALKAWEAGYFPETQGERPLINELLDKIGADHTGQPQYSEHDLDAAEAFRHAVQQNHEIDRLAAELGIDAAKMSPAEFWAKVGEQVSVEEMAKREAEKAAAFEHEFEEAEKRAKEYLESRGEAWEPDHFTHGNPRSLEDLEREYAAEQAAGGTRAIARGPEQPGPAATDQGPVQEGGGPGGNDAGTSGRAGGKTAAGGSGVRGGSAGELPAGPNSALPAAGSSVLDKAGNIRLENLNTPLDVDRVIHEMADANEGFTGVRQPVTDADALDLADAMGLRPEDLDLGQVQQFSRAHVFAVRKLFVATASDARDLALKAAEGSDADVMAYAQGRARLRMVQEYLSGLTYAAGSALRGFQALPGSEEAKGFAEALGNMGGDFAEERTLFQLKQEARRLSQLDTSRKVSKYLREADKPGLGEMALELFINNLISGPITHATYATGNALLAIWKAIPETFAEATIGAAREALGSKQPRAYFAEIPAQLYAMFGKGQRDGFRALWDAVKAGQTVPLPGETVRGIKDMFSGDEKGPSTPFTSTKAIPDFKVGGVPIPLGSAIRIPGERMVAPIHSYYRTIGYVQSIARQATRTAISEGLAGDALDARIASLTSSPSDAMMKVARGEATDQTMMGQGGELMRSVSRLLNYRFNLPLLGQTRLFRFIDPFVQVFGAMARETVIKRGLPNLLSADMRGENGSIAQNAAGARVAMGVSLSAVGAGLAAEGIINPSAPTDPRQREIWTKVHGLPHSVKVGEVSYDLSRLGVLGMQLGISADLYNVADVALHGDLAHAGSLVVHSVAQNFLDEGFAKGISDLLKAVDDNDRYGQQWAQNFAKSFVPYSVGLGQVARLIDPYAREARGVTDQILSGIPLESESLEPRRDIWGEPVPNRAWGLVFSQALQDDPTNRELLKLGVFPAQPSRKIRGIPLTDQQYDDLSRIGGRYAKMLVDHDVAMPSWGLTPAEQRVEMVRRDIETARESARTAILMDDYSKSAPGQSIMDRAAALKTAPLKGAEQ